MKLDMKKIMFFSLISFMFTSCFDEIDIEPLEKTFESTFTVENSIKTTQTFYRFYENVVTNVSENSPAKWDLAFESFGDGGRVLTNYAITAKVIKTGEYNINEVTQNDVISLIPSDEWMFDDPAYTNYTDSLSLQDWEDGEVYVLKRGTNDEYDYYKIQFVSRNEDEYTFNYARAIETSYHTVTIPRTDGLAYRYFSFTTCGTVDIEPQIETWHIMFTPYYGWYETLTPGEYSPYNMSGVLINYEGGVEIAHIFSDTADFANIDESYIEQFEFTDWKGAVGSNWKLLGDQTSGNVYEMDPVKKYLMKVYDQDEDIFKYYKFRFIDYKLDGEDHHPTVEFKFLANEVSK